MMCAVNVYADAEIILDGAADIAVTDSGGYFAGTDVEAVLQELGATEHAAITLDANADTLLSLSTQELGLDTQAANHILSGPTTGGDAVPTFRALVDNDIPDDITITETNSLETTITGILDGEIFVGNGANSGTFRVLADGDIPNNITIDLATTVTTNANLTGEVTSVGNATTIADNITVTGWTMGSSVATTPGANDNDTSLATTAFCETTQNYLKTSDLAGAETDPNVDTSAEIIAIINAGASGYLEHEVGGLEADVNAYDGLIGITGGATYNQTGTTTQIIIFDGAGAPASAALSGDITMTNAGVTAIGADKVFDSMLNLGTGATQISASDMPDEDIGDITIVSGVYTVDPGSIHDLTINAKEENTSAIVKGQAVYVSGAAGVGQTLVGLVNNTDSTKIRMLGLASSAFAQNGVGTVRIRGELSGVDTLGANAVNPNDETWTAGDILYCTNGGSGGLTNVKPTSGRIIRAGYSLVGSHNNDTILVEPHANPVCLSAASGEDICVRMGDNDGAKKVCFKDYANNDVACVDSNGIYTCTGLTIGSAAILEAELEILDGATLSTTQINYLNAATGTTGTTSTNLVFSTSPTLVTPEIGAATGTSLELSGASILANATASGVLTLGGSGGTNNENETSDYESVANSILKSTTTGVTGVDHNYDFFVGARFGEGNRVLPAAGTDHRHRIYSDDTTNNTDYLELYHDQTDGCIATGAGDLCLSPASGITTSRGSGAQGLEINSTTHNNTSLTFLRTGNAYQDWQLKNSGGVFYCEFSNDDGSSWLPFLYMDTEKLGIKTTSPDRLLHAEETSALTNTVQQVVRITHITAGTPANNIGVGMEFEQETAADNNEVIAAIEAICTDVTPTSEEGALSFKVMVAGAAVSESARIDSSVTSGDTRFMLYDVDNATMERVTVGAADSGGAGYKVLRIPN